MPIISIQQRQFRRPFHHLVRIRTILRVETKNLPQKPFSDLRQPLSQVLKRLVHNLLIQYFLRHSPPRHNSLDKLKKDNPNSPNIATNTINIILECLRRHIDRTTNIVMLMTIQISNRNSKPKIRILINPILV